MRLGSLVAVFDGGEAAYIGEPGEIDALDSIMREITDAGGVVEIDGKKRKAVRLMLNDLARDPLKVRNP